VKTLFLVGESVRLSR
jgi:hypothetical protein